MTSFLPRVGTVKMGKAHAAWEYDEAVREDSGWLICGVDEAGRGPLAGPVVAGAVVLPRDLDHKLLYDSKSLTAHEREWAYELIVECALSWAVGSADAKYIDQHNILQATYEAMRRAISQLSIAPDIVLVDGVIIPGVSIRQRKLIKGDTLSQSIGAASILAKVTRDRYMVGVDSQFPEYGFSKHMGYGTKQHLQALVTYGPTDIHRESFAPVKRVMQPPSHDESNTVAIHDARRPLGQLGERSAIAYLEDKGYRLLQQNWRVPVGEIDAIMQDGDTTVFVEVRARVGSDPEASWMVAAASVNGVKQAKIKQLANWYMQRQQPDAISGVRCDVVVVTWDAQGRPLCDHYENAF